MIKKPVYIGYKFIVTEYTGRMPGKTFIRTKNLIITHIKEETLEIKHPML
jgi:hypothetical protein